MADLANYGGVMHGSRTITIGGLTYVAQNISISRPTVDISTRNANGEPNGFVLVEDFVTGSATLTVATGSSTIPACAATFSTTFTTVEGSETFVITSVEQPEDQNGVKTVRINFKKTTF